MIRVDVSRAEIFEIIGVVALVDLDAEIRKVPGEKVCDPRPAYVTKQIVTMARIAEPFKPTSVGIKEVGFV